MLVVAIHSDNIYCKYSKSDIITGVNSGTYEWDEAKDRSNVQKHGVSFAEAVTAFGDERGFDVYDDRRDYGEERWVWFGRVSGRLLIIAVAFTEREDAIRIISARPAEPDEETAYYEGGML